MKELVKEFNRKQRNKKILKMIRLPQTGNILDLSCGDGKFINSLHKLSPNIKLVGIDVSDNDLGKARNELPFASFNNENVDNLSFTDGTFDVVFSVMSLHHYQNPEKFLSETFRVLKNGGKFYLVDLVPKYDWGQKLYNWKGCPEPYHFEKFYSLKDIEKLVESIGFKIKENKKISSVPRIRLIDITKI